MDEGCGLSDTELIAPTATGNEPPEGDKTRITEVVVTPNPLAVTRYSPGKDGALKIKDLFPNPSVAKVPAAPEVPDTKIGTFGTAAPALSTLLRLIVIGLPGAAVAGTAATEILLSITWIDAIFSIPLTKILALTTHE